MQKNEALKQVEKDAMKDVTFSDLIRMFFKALKSKILFWKDEKDR